MLASGEQCSKNRYWLCVAGLTLINLKKRLNMVDLMNLKPVYPRNITCLCITWAIKGDFKIPEVHISMWENIGRAKIRLLIN